MLREVATAGRGTAMGAHGRLRAPLDAMGLPSVRCACDTCGAHLLASVGASGGLHGYCPTCGGETYRPVGDPGGTPQFTAPG